MSPSTPLALNVRVAGRLAAGFALLLVLTTVLGLYCIRSADRVHAAGDQVATNWLPAMRALTEYRSAMGTMQRSVANYVMLNDVERISVELPRIAAARLQADVAWKAYLQTIADDEERRGATRVADADARFRAMQDGLLQMPRGGGAADDALRKAFFGASRDAVDDLYNVLGDLVNYQQRGAQLAHSAATRDYATARYVATAVVIAAVTVSAVLGLMIATSIGHDVTSLRSAYESVLRTGSQRASELELANERLVHANAKLEQETLSREAAEDALERLNRRKDEFIATVAHELRGPLSALSNAAALLRAGGDTEHLRKHATGVVERQSRQMARLVDDLTDVSRLVTGKVSLQLEGLDLEKVIEAAVELLGPTITERRQLLHVNLQSSESCQIIGDQGRLLQVFANLLGNASRYTPEGGRISIELAREDADAVVRVRDNGAGIAPEMVERIFDMFGQGGKPEGSAAGLGLGLALALQIAQLHGGDLTGESPGIGRGACFTLRLPLQAGSVCDAPVPPAATATARDGSVVPA
jgi:signal transduction histidine kinase